jgi:hypothetical protein
MSGEFSENSKRLLKDSLTMQSLGFMREIVVPERDWRDAALAINLLFTMTAARNGTPPRRMRRP